MEVFYINSLWEMCSFKNIVSILCLGALSDRRNISVTAD